MKKHLPILDVKAAFVDVGSEHMHVSVGGDEPKVFGSVTGQLHALRDWLLAQGVRSVAMEATGVYWLPLYGVLEAAGLAESRRGPGQQERAHPVGGDDQGRGVRPAACECEAGSFDADADAGHRLANNESIMQQASSQKML